MTQQELNCIICVISPYLILLFKKSLYLTRTRALVVVFWCCNVLFVCCGSDEKKSGGERSKELCCK
jgi:hypothetical protein